MSMMEKFLHMTRQIMQPTFQTDTGEETLTHDDDSEKQVVDEETLTHVEDNGIDENENEETLTHHVDDIVDDEEKKLQSLTVKMKMQVKMKKKMTKAKIKMKLQQMFDVTKTNLQPYQRNRTNNQN